MNALMRLKSPSGEPASTELAGVSQCSREATRAWRRLRVWQRSLAALPPTLLAMSAGGLGLEFLGGGLEPSDLGVLCLGLLFPLLAGLSALVQRIGASEALTELDRRVGAADRLGTAWEFAGDPSPMAGFQRADAEQHARSIEVAQAFPLVGGGKLRLSALLLLLLLCVWGGGLVLDLSEGADEEPAGSEDTAIARLLESVESDRSWFDARGDKRAVSLLTDLERKIRQIEEREQALEQAIRERPEEVEGPEESLPDDAVTQFEPQTDLLDLDAIERMEEAFMEQLQLSDAQEAELVAQLFARTREAERLIQGMEDLIHEEHNVSFSSGEGPQPMPNEQPSMPFEGMESGMGMTGNPGIDQNLGSIGNPIERDMDLHTRDLSEEALAEHDRTHDTQESFNQFLKEFAGELQQMAAEKATGRKRKKRDNGKTLPTNSGQGVADRSASMEEKGFEEVGAQKRHSSKAPPEDLAGSELSGGKPGGTPQAGGPMSSSSMAMKGSPTGETSPGSSGAGSGSSHTEEGLKTLLEHLAPENQNPIEELMSRLNTGRMPPEQREALFEQLARLQVRTGPGAGSDEDLTTDYFHDANELLVANRENLPPLFRDYAHDYFQAIRPEQEEADER